MSGSDVEFNVAKGRVVELHDRVVNNDPANSGLVVITFEVIEADAALIQHETVDAITTASNTENTYAGYNRKVLTDVDLSASAVDHTASTRWVDIDDPNWTPTAVEDIVKLVIAYDPDTTAGDDTTLVPLVAINVEASGGGTFTTTSGVPVTINIDALGYFRG